MSLNCTISNIQFDYAFMKYCEDRGMFPDDRREKDTFRNGLPYQTVLMFKTMCTMRDDENVHTNMLKNKYSELYGIEQTQASVSRIVSGLRDKLGLIESILPPSNESRIYSYVRLTANGRKLQKLFMGSASDWKDKPKAVVERIVKTAGKEK